MFSTEQMTYRLRRLIRRLGGSRALIEYDGQVIYRLPVPISDKPSCLMFTQPKSGSKMVRGILRALARQSGLEPTGPEGVLFEAGLPRSEIPANISAIFMPKGYFYHFSNVPTEYSISIDARSLVHVRDVRDVLVSKYYSLRDSHPEPGDAIKQDKKLKFAERREMLRQLDVDAGVLELATPGLSASLKGLREVANRPGAMLSRYEDMVYRKCAWAEDVCRHFGWDRPSSAIVQAVAPFDVFPKGERPEQHVRQVHPGNFRKKLKPETICTLNTLFEEDLKFFGYSAQ